MKLGCALGEKFLLCGKAFMKERIEYYAVKLLLSLFRILPVAWVYRIFDLLGRFFFRLLKRRRLLANKNIALSNLGIIADAECDALAKKVFQSSARTVAEALLIFSGRYKIEQHIKNKPETVDKLKKIFAEKKSAVFFTAHFGSWEILSHFLAQQGYPLIVIARKGDNTLIEQNITTPFRELYGNRNVYKQQAMREITRGLKNSQNTGILIDQKSDRKEGVATTFFGRQCYTTASVARLKLKYNPLIIPIFARRCPDNRYEMVIYDSVEFTGNPEDDQERRVTAMTQRYSDIMEEVIRKTPEQWLWMHNRWRIEF